MQQRLLLSYRLCSGHSLRGRLRMQHPRLTDDLCRRQLGGQRQHSVHQLRGGLIQHPVRCCLQLGLHTVRGRLRLQQQRAQRADAVRCWYLLPCRGSSADCLPRWILLPRRIQRTQQLRSWHIQQRQLKRVQPVHCRQLLPRWRQRSDCLPRRLLLPCWLQRCYQLRSWYLQRRQCQHVQSVQRGQLLPCWRCQLDCLYGGLLLPRRLHRRSCLCSRLRVCHSFYSDSLPRW